MLHHQYSNSIFKILDVWKVSLAGATRRVELPPWGPSIITQWISLPKGVRSRRRQPPEGLRVAYKSNLEA